jgi:hypothetical protein
MGNVTVWLEYQLYGSTSAEVDEQRAAIKHDSLTAIDDRDPEATPSRCSSPSFAR